MLVKVITCSFLWVFVVCTYFFFLVAMKGYRGSRPCIDKKKSSTILLIYSQIDVHSVAKVYAVLTFYDVKFLCSGGQE